MSFSLVVQEKVSTMLPASGLKKRKKYVISLSIFQFHFKGNECVKPKVISASLFNICFFIQYLLLYSISASLFNICFFIQYLLLWFNSCFFIQYLVLYSISASLFNSCFFIQYLLLYSISASLFNSTWKCPICSLIAPFWGNHEFM